MEIDLGREIPAAGVLPPGYVLLPWDPALLSAHATAKFHAFRDEVDATVFPCLGDYDGCLRLMNEIRSKEGFLKEATWLIAKELVDEEMPVGWGRSIVSSSATPTKMLEYCGTIQGIRDRYGYGAVQNLGITPGHRGKGLGKVLLLKAIEGFAAANLRRAILEVTADNAVAISLYKQIGFQKTQTLFKTVELMSVAVR